VEKRYKIAVIDDEKSIQRTLAFALRAADYDLSFYDSGSAALEPLKADPPDLVILDIMMPGIDGITFCSLLRKENQRLPVIFLSARADELSRIEALERGGDDYLTKPFSIKELTVRIAVCLRRVEQYQDKGFATDGRRGDSPFSVDYPAWEVSINGQVVGFSVTEFRIFTALYGHPGMVFTRERLMRIAYPEDAYISDRNVDMHITRIRKKICSRYPEFRAIETIYGLGYRYKESKNE
jgi:two-component system, OmpR family, response regulator ChvI